ncbi:RNA polymerase sigma factor [Sanguibacter antarcticus]|uniref:RNA polymerase sigma factor (Sigma-70 family) n=1 Tax=Sanguibacter antarcticus TaxID=372484 RepID=A0A2A9E503_9MICO|nr:sigma-70 family RNA polymerase sigma factor [Sanguibacter antarcticus]PFG34038.1 RNA polymerase sigma factor (sigma-70 family) [Sanguibacter antarcticus]
MGIIADETSETGFARGGLAERASRALTAYRAGFPALMSEVVRETTPLLWHTIRSQGVDREVAEDLVQGVWLAFVRNMDSIRESDAVLQWLLVAARRAAWESVRQRRAEAARRALVDDLDRATPDVAEREPAPDVQVLTSERDRTLWERYSLLPERCQELLKLISLADRPDYKHISEALDMPVGSIGATRGRCLAKLRTLLAGDDVWGTP